MFGCLSEAFLGCSVLGRAMRQGLFSVETIDIRAFSKSKHHNTDDYPYGGGAGMVMMAQPILDAMASVTQSPFEGRRVYLSPRGEPFTQRIAERFSRMPELVLLCGHYEGVDQRALDLCVDEEISIGDYVLTGGEPAALVVIDTIARLLPGVLGSKESSVEESFSETGLLEYPQYTRPREIAGQAVPEVLLSGNHARIEEWRRQMALRVTWERRPDLVHRARITDVEKQQLIIWETERM